MKVSFQGEPGAYSEQAILNYFYSHGTDITTYPCESFDLMFDSVVTEKSDMALVPIENSLAGSIHQNYDLLLKHNLHIVGEYFLRVRHCLIALPDAGVEKKDIKQAISHPQALGQCASYLRHHGIKALPVYDTAGSVKMLKESGSKDMAAIASKRAADLYGMHILEEGIEDNTQNYTRFLVVSREANVPEAEKDSKTNSKTSIVFTLKNSPGSLFKAMSVFSLRDIDLTKIESRPLQGKPWEYLFYVDFLGTMRDDRVQRALSHLEEYATTFRVFGSYHRCPSINS